MLMIISLGAVSQQSSPRFLYIPGVYSVHFFGEDRMLFCSGDSIQLSTEMVGTPPMKMIRAWSPDTEPAMDDSTGNVLYYAIGKWENLPYDSSAEYVDGYFYTWDMSDTTKFQASWNCYNELQLSFKGKILIKRR